MDALAAARQHGNHLDFYVIRSIRLVSMADSNTSAAQPAESSPNQTAQSASRTDVGAYTAGQVLLCLGAVLAVIGAFLPWLTVDAIIASRTITGLDGDGVVTLALAVILLGIFAYDGPGTPSVKLTAVFTVAPDCGSVRDVPL